MAKPKNNAEQVSFISVPTEINNYLSLYSLQSLLLSPKKQKRNRLFSFNSFRSLKAWFFTLFLFCFLGIIRLWFNLDRLVPFSPYPCWTSKPHQDSFSNEYLRSQFPFDANAAINAGGQRDQKGWFVSGDGYVDFSSNGEKIVEGKDPKLVISNQNEKSVENEETSDFWKQPDGLGYRPCLNFSQEYKKWSEAIVRDRRKYLLVVVSGGINQQKNQIVDAVVIARILGAALVVPILQVNVIWEDESEFYDIFDLEHFKRVLANDVRIVSSLPSTHIMTRPVEEKRTPLHVSPQWIRSRYLRRLNREGILLLRGLDSRLSKDLPSDLQKLRCKVAFHALKFAPQILELGNKLTERLWSKGPYLALHLRMEKDVWVRTGCLPGLSREYDEMISTERKQRPELLTARSNMSFHDRRLSGLCPLTSMEVTRLLKALGAPNNAIIYWAGGQPLGGKEALLPLSRNFPHLYSKEDVALPGELEPFEKRASFMAAIDYIVSVNSDVFMPSHGGNMGHAIQGDRAYAGHKKYITPNKRHMLPYFLNSSLPEEEFNRIIKELHSESIGQPELRTSKPGRDVTKYPVPECMCSNDSHNSS